MKMETKPKWEKELTTNEFDIMDYINSNGGFAVEVSASIVKQNKNFYLRVKKLENFGLIQVCREQGMASLMTITNKGRDVLTYLKLKNIIDCNVKENLDRFSEEELLISIIKNSNIPESKKSQLFDILL